MKIMIDGRIFTQQSLQQWRRKRAIHVLKACKAPIDLSDQTDDLCRQLTDLKIKLSSDDMRQRLNSKLIVSERLMKLARILSGEKRSAAKTIIYAEGLTAEDVSSALDKLMLEATEENRRINLAVCPDHYVLHPHKGILEVIETAGNSPLPTQFFITFNDETGLKEPRNLDYTHQSVGVAKLKDGTVVGGVRHQFKDTPTGIKARLLVEFPAICPKSLLRAHQKHLAAEWSGWLTHIKNNPSGDTDAQTID